MTKLTLTNLTSLTNEQSAIAAINANNDAIEAAIENTYSRNGLTPNTLTDDLDMNGFRIMNMAAPVDDNDPVRLIDVVDGIKGDTGDTGAPGGPLADGDYGDIVVSSNGSVINVDTGVMTSVARTLNAQTTQALMRTTGLALGNSSTKDVGTVANTVAAGNDSRFTAFTINPQSGATYTFVLADAGKLIKQNAASTHTYTIPPAASVNFPEGTVIVLRNDVGAGIMTLVRGSGVTLYSNGSTTSANATIAPGGTITLIQDDADIWYGIGPGVS